MDFIHYIIDNTKNLQGIALVESIGSGAYRDKGK